MATATPRAAATSTRARRRDPPFEGIIYGHSWLLYWWPVWVLGYVMAFLTWLHPVVIGIDGTTDLFSPGNNLGVIFTLFLLVVILITSTNMRGMGSGVVLVCVAFLVLLFAYLHWWDAILNWFGNQSVHLNLGFYFFFSTALLILWVIVVFGFDRLSFWRVRPGQITHEYLMGVVDRSYDTENMVFSKSQGDLFRHWILGLGSGDLQMQTLGGLGMATKVDNVLFIGDKVSRIQRLIATKPGVTQEA